MKKNLFIIILFLAIAVMLFSCKDTKNVMQPGITGNSYEIMTVMNKTIWQSTVGDSIKSIFMQDMDVLPQSEPLFTMVNIPIDFFKQEKKTHRNILQVVISKKVKKADIVFKRDAWARHQLFVKILAPDNESFYKLLDENRTRLLSLFLNEELKRLKRYYSKYPNTEIFNNLKDKMGFTLSIPKGYNLNLDTTKFVWISSETPKNSRGIIAYTYPYTSQKQFMVKNLIKKRNSILKSYIPGPVFGSYMSTDTITPYSVRQYDYHGRYAMEIRGLWRVENDFMGGPFVNIAVLDERTNMIIVVDGYVYAPQDDKRNLMRQVEAIMHTLNFPENEEKK